MPEGDTVWRTARRLHEALAGAEVTGSELRWGTLVGTSFTGRHTVEVVSRGKHLLHRFDDGRTLHSHLRMEGQWRVAATARVSAGTLRDDRLRALVASADWTALGLRLGMLDVVPTAQEHRLVGHLGPDILGPDWDLGIDLGIALANLRARPDRPVAEALLDQRNLAGIGTMYCAETLFVRRQRPWQPVGELSADDLGALVDQARRFLDANRSNAVQTTTGLRARGQEHYAHARSGRPCRRCGDTVRVGQVGEPPTERVMFYCPTCQGGLAPGDDGRSLSPLGSSTASPQRRRRDGYRNRVR